MGFPEETNRENGGHVARKGRGGPGRRALRVQYLLSLGFKGMILKVLEGNYRGVFYLGFIGLKLVACLVDITPCFWGLRHFRVNLLAVHFEVCTDHKPLL
jgi:hypothetical protein